MITEFESGHTSDLEDEAERGEPLRPGADRASLVDRAIKLWKSQLVDLSARNNLLYYRKLKAGTLDLTGHEIFLDELLAGKEVRLSRVFAAEVPRQSFEKRARTIRAKAKEAFEERGLDTLFLAYGMATWHEDSDRRSKPNAPITLVPVSLEPVASGGQDYSLRITGEPRVNPTLLRKLASDFGSNIDHDAIDAQLIDATSTADLTVAFAAVSRAQGIPEFQIKTEAVLGTFSYAKLPMVLDLERARDSLIEHDLVAALCGDAEARSAIVDRNSAQSDVGVDEPDRIPPENEFLVLDADSSQSLAINRVLAGRDLIIQGPPGTGKSQTIANLVAGLIANGKSVLFVAEKRAAIDAVFKRLRQVGLDDLLLDMHDGQKGRGPFAAALNQSIRSSGRLPLLDLTESQNALVAARDKLSARTRAQHVVREPWGISVFDARIALAGVTSVSACDLRLDPQTLQLVTKQTMGGARENMGRWFQFDAIGIAAAGGSWSRSPVRCESDSQQAAEAARAALEAVRAARVAVPSFAANTGLPEPNTADEMAAQLSLAEDVLESATWFDHRIFQENLPGLTDALLPWEEGGFSRVKGRLSSVEYRAAQKQVQNLLSEGAKGLKDRECYQRLIAARDQKLKWQSLAGEESAPALVVDIERFRQLQTRVAVAAERLERFSPGLALLELDFEAADGLLQEMSTSGLRTLAAVAEINQIRDWFAENHLLAVLESVARDGLLELEAIARLDWVWMTSIVENMTLADSATLGAMGPTATVSEFQKRDREHIDSGAERVRRACAESAVAARDEHHEQSVLIERQAKLKPRSRKHLPVRDFFSKAPDVLQAIKPCWAMSPLVVSQTLPAERDLFDVVIFDEASQVTPADAIPAILRGRQLVIAGDARQLPPTAFFVSEPDEEVDDDFVPADGGTEGYESVLDALTGLMPEQMLTWHYRSRDERLIAFSNAHIYNRTLTTFPGAISGDVVSHVLVDSSLQAMPGSDQNREEVEAVVDQIIEHAVERPDESLGVIAMGIKHAERVSDALRLRLDEYRTSVSSPLNGQEIESFFGESREEPFFVKNLERVQGDERDAIVLTVGYGKDPTTGKMLYRFGPLLMDGGERRLNVAITRAKRRMTVVSSFSSTDLDPEKLNKPGAKLLGAYIAYAESGGNSLGSMSELPPAMNAFELQVHDALKREGLQLTPQHGVSGYRLDFGVRHPDRPGEYVLAIECDGVSYHSSPTARERDRLRQQMLEQLGWRFCRIWSSDWFDDRATELQRVLASYEHAVAFADGKADPDPFESAASAPPLSERPSAKARAPRPYVSDQYDPYEIARLIRWIETDTLLRTRSELFSETLRELGFARPGSRITPAIVSAIDLARSSEAILDDDSWEPPSTSDSTDWIFAKDRPPAPSAGTRERTRRNPTMQELQSHDAVRIKYSSKSGNGSAKTRIVNPLKFSGRLMWAWCHTRDDVRCFNITRISEWESVDGNKNAPPKNARELADLEIEKFNSYGRSR